MPTQIQSTRPQTLSYGLTDSPAGPLTPALLIHDIRLLQHPHHLNQKPGRRRTRVPQPDSARQPKHTRPTEDSMPELPWTQGASSLWADVADSKAATSRRWPRGDSRATTGVARIARKQTGWRAPSTGHRRGEGRKRRMKGRHSALPRGQRRPHHVRRDILGRPRCGTERAQPVEQLAGAVEPEPALSGPVSRPATAGEGIPRS